MDLKALKERKRKLLMDAQLIKNRCNLLEQENQKTWKTIEESKKRAQEVLLNKARIEHDAVQKYQLSTIRDQDRRERQERIQQTKQPKGFGANYLMKLKHDKFRLEKQIKSENRQARSTIQREHMRQGRVRSLDARLNKPRAEERQRLIQEAKSNMVHRDKNRRLDEETYHCDQSHREIQEFEYLEVEMAKRLAYSQQLHQHTLDHVEQSLNILNI